MAQVVVMTCEEFVAYLRRIRLKNNPAALAHIRAELDLLHPTGRVSQGDVLRHVGLGDPIAFERTMQHVYAGSTFVR